MISRRIVFCSKANFLFSSLCSCTCSAPALHRFPSSMQKTAALTAQLRHPPTRSVENLWTAEEGFRMEQIAQSRSRDCDCDKFSFSFFLFFFFLLLLFFSFLVLFSLLLVFVFLFLFLFSVSFAAEPRLNLYLNLNLYPYPHTIVNMCFLYSTTNKNISPSNPVKIM